MRLCLTEKFMLCALKQMGGSRSYKEDVVYYFSAVLHISSPVLSCRTALPQLRKLN